MHELCLALLESEVGCCLGVRGQQLGVRRQEMRVILNSLVSLPSRQAGKRARRVQDLIRELCFVSRILSIAYRFNITKRAIYSLRHENVLLLRKCAEMDPRCSMASSRSAGPGSFIGSRMTPSLCLLLKRVPTLPAIFQPHLLLYKRSVQQ